MRGSVSSALACSLCVFGWLTVPVEVHADEPWLISLEADVMAPITKPQVDLYRPGIAGSVAVHYPIVPWVLAGARVRGGLLFDGDPPSDPGREDPKIGTLATFSGSFRLRPLATRDDPRRGTGLWIDVGGGPALSRDVVRGFLDVGVGWGFEVGKIDIGPSVRYMQVFQPRDDIDGRDARLILAGIEVTFLDARRLPVSTQRRRAPNRDRDGDGILDARDQCPNEPEDKEGFEDEDGCPEPDNDKDGILDAEDACPDEPEDKDEFSDEDGCPEPDNDNDGFLDAQDSCPNEAEVVNGVEDDDGCPDSGLIELIGDRIVLEEQVLFDFERARVKHASHPVIQAIVNLVHMHPEWARLRIEGHTDVRGSDEFNQRLSERRAQNVMRALIEAGIPAGIIDHVGYGKSKPRDEAEGELAHRRNRRVEFVVMARRRITSDADRLIEENPTPPQVPDDQGTSSEPTAKPEGSP